MNQYEKEFGKELERIAPLFRCRVIGIPDVVPLGKDGKALPKGERPAISYKRPFDCVLVTPRQNYCIELKYQHGKLKPHQAETMQKINAVNSSYYVVRKKLLKKGTVYTISQENDILGTDKLEDIFKFFSSWDIGNGETARKLLIDDILPTKKTKIKRKVIG